MAALLDADELNIQHEEDDLMATQQSTNIDSSLHNVLSGSSSQAPSLDPMDPTLLIIDEVPPRRKLPRIRGRTMILRTRATFHNRWPYSIGIAEIAFGFLTLSLGILEIMIIPLVMDTDPSVRFEFKKSNCYGVGIWTGIMLILTGSLAVRASLAKRATSVYRFYLMTTVTLGVYVCALVLLIYGFSSGWTPDTSPGESTAISTVHSINAVAVFIGFLLALVAFIQYYEDVFCGELQLCQRLGKIFCPCCCPPRQNEDPPDTTPTCPCPI